MKQTKKEEPCTTTSLYDQYKKSKPPRTIPKANLVRLKIISMGEAEVGKSTCIECTNTKIILGCLIKRYCEERFVARYIPTIGVDFGVKKVNEVRVNFWDLSGHPHFFEVRNEFYKDTQGAILVFDVQNRKSFEALSLWMTECNKYGATENMVTVVCGNKIDDDPKRRTVSEKEAREWCIKNGYKYFETSALTGDNVSEMFDALFTDAMNAFFEVN